MLFYSLCFHVDGICICKNPLPALLIAYNDDRIPNEDNSKRRKDKNEISEPIYQR